jgi:hypothetical protein
MAARTRHERQEVTSADDLACELFEVPFNLDALDLGVLAGDWFASSSDPHYADLPCYVPLIDDDGLDPFVVEKDIGRRPTGPHRKS